MGRKEEERTDGGVVVVKPNPRKGVASKALDWLEWALVKLLHDPKKPLHYLSGNFAPVDETPPLQDLPVVGHLPVSPNMIVMFVLAIVYMFLDQFYGNYIFFGMFLKIYLGTAF